VTTLRTAWQEAAAFLSQAGVGTPQLDAEVLLRSVTGKSREEFYRDLEEPLPASCLHRLHDLLAERAMGTPVAYLTGSKEFFGLEFKVTPAVLIPRPETELLVEQALGLVRQGMLPPDPRVLDLGTGSGAIAVTLAVHLPAAHVVATDLSAAALAVAAENARRHKVEERIEFRRGDLWAALAEEGAGATGPRFDLIVSNPPYIPTEELRHLPREVQKEPAAALDGGPDGLAFYRRLARGLPAFVAPGGWVLLEVGDGQAPAVCRLLAEVGLTLLSAARDLAGIERVVQATH